MRLTKRSKKDYKNVTKVYSDQYIASELRRRVKKYIESAKHADTDDEQLFRSITNWTVEKILSEIWETYNDPDYVIEKYIRMFDAFSCEGASSSYMFSIAKDAAVWMLDELILIEEK